MPLVFNSRKVDDAVFGQRRIAYGVSGGRIVFRKGMPTDLVRLTPAMTSNTTPAPFATSASSEYGTEYAAWKACDDNPDTFWNSAQGQGNNAWWMVAIDAPRQVGQLVIHSRNVHDGAGTQFPRNFTVEGSSDGASFETILTVADNPKPTGPLQRYTYNLTGNFKFVRIRIAQNWGDGATSFSAVELYGY